MFTIDGIQWPYPCKIERVSEIRPSDISGMLLDRSWFNDVLGQFLSYDITVAVPLNRRDAYTALYETLSEPADGHSFVLPYAAGTIELTGRVENVRDVYVRLADGRTYWKGTRFTVTANHPTRALTLSEAITRGRAPLPEAADPSEGDTYIYSDGTWVEAPIYEDADDKSY